jgi:hypothetical protein
MSKLHSRPACKIVERDLHYRTVLYTVYTGKGLQNDFTRQKEKRMSFLNKSLGRHA